VTVSLGSTGRLPAAGSFTAVAVSVTVSHPTAATAAAVLAPHAAAATRVVTAPAKRVATGFTVVPVDSTGRLRARLSKGHADLRIDVLGYLSDVGAGDMFHPLAPATVLKAHRVSGHGTRRVSVVGAPRTGLPPNGHVAAVALAVTASRPSASTTVTAYPRGSRASTSPVVSAHHGTTTSGLTVVGVGAHGDVALRNAHGHATLSAVVEGYWTTDPIGSSFRSVTPTELYEGSTAANAWRSVRVTGRAGLPARSGVSAAMLSITVGPSSHSGSLVVAPTRQGFPARGAVSVAAHTTVTTSVLARISHADVRIYASRRMPIAVSVIGWYGATANGVDVNAGPGSCASGLDGGARFALIRATSGVPYTSADADCFATDLAMAQHLPAAPQFYMNLADPGKASAGHWNDGGPKACHVTHNYDPSCAYDYGYRAAAQAVGFARSQGMAAGSRWWVDVETDNTWGSKERALPGHHAANAADIQGALRYLKAHGFPAGVYTETSWWGPITGSSTAFSHTPVWGGGADSPKNARANCKAVSITGGPALVAQWFVDKTDDHDIAC
jgi:hypothetical protein